MPLINNALSMIVWSMPCQTCRKCCFSKQNWVCYLPRMFSSNRELKQQVSKLSSLKLCVCTLSSAFSSRYAKTWTSNFRNAVQLHTEGMVGGIIWVLLEIYLAFQQRKNFYFWKSVKNWQSYRHEFGVLLFWDTVYFQFGNTNVLQGEKHRITLCTAILE